MMKRIVLGLIFSCICTNIYGQYQWQDPLDFNDFSPTNKYGLLLNIGGTVLTNILTKNEYQSYWAASIYGGYLTEYDSHTVSSNSLNINGRIGKQLRSYLQLGLEGQLNLFFNDNTHVIGASGLVYFNWYLINNDKFKLYFDNAYGFIVTNEPFPQEGTRFNFYRYYGLSTNFRYLEDNFLRFGLRTIHISNAYLFGDNNNPAFDGIGINIGIEL